MDEPDDDCVPAEELKIFHCDRVECGNCEGVSGYGNALRKRRHARIVVRGGLIDNQTIRSRDATLETRVLMGFTLTISLAVIWP
jgi:hypothetical protein